MVPEQVACVQHLRSCLEAGRPAIVQGTSGSGKTTTWLALKGSMIAQGQQVRGNACYAECLLGQEPSSANDSLWRSSCDSQAGRRTVCSVTSSP